VARTKIRRDPAAASTADRLLAGAADLFRRKGYAGTTTRELSALLGLQSGSLYYHMEKKEDLLYRLCLVSLQDVARDLEATASEPDPTERLAKMLRAYVIRALEDRDRHATMLVELRALSTVRRNQIVKMRDKNVAMFFDTFVEAQQMGQVRSDVSPKMLTLAMFNLANWSIFWFRPDGEESATEIADVLCTIFLQGVALKPERSQA
jgi:TetR/AcrR family transcriptional regulator, cholesterol catabolism regulator